MKIGYSADQLRAMYAGGKGDRTARRWSRWWAAAFRVLPAPRRWVVLEVAGRRTGRVAAYPLGMADWQGEWFLVPMLGAQCNWARNLQAAGGRAVVRRRRVVAERLVEVPVAERAPILRRYLEKVPGARPHMGLDRRASLVEFARIAPDYPVWRLVPTAGGRRSAAGAHHSGQFAGSEPVAGEFCRMPPGAPTDSSSWEKL